MRPLLSVIVPSFNQGHYLRRALMSILRQGLGAEAEVLVADGGSSDCTLEVLRGFNTVRSWSKPDGGFVDAVNRGLHATSGEFVAIMSCDDFYLPGALRLGLAILRSDPRLCLVTGSGIVVDEAGRVVDAAPLRSLDIVSPAQLLSGEVSIPQHCTIARRSALDAVGGLRPSVDRCADVDLWYRLLHFGVGAVIPAYLGCFQLHPRQRTRHLAREWMRAQREMVESCERDARYASRFVPPAASKREFLLRSEIFWSWHAGNPGERRTARVAARRVQASADEHERATVEIAQAVLSNQALSRVRRSIALLMRAARRPATPDVAAAIDVDWWSTGTPEQP